ncbi:MAG: type II secretion system F family protein [Phycisphaeraceae bacterium]
MILALAGITTMLLTLVVGGVLIRLDRRMRSQIEQRPRLRKAIDENPLIRLTYPLIYALSGPLSAAAPRGMIEQWREMTRRAGAPAGLSAEEHVAISALIGSLAAAFLTGSMLMMTASLDSLLGLSMAIVGPLLIMTTLRARGAAREHQIQMAMPYVLDLMVLTLRSGTSLNLALRRIVADYASHPLGQEIDEALSEIELGAQRREALMRLSDRTRLPEIRDLVETINQAQELGWPMADTLERLAEGMNIARVVKAQDSAGKASSLVMMPAMLVLASAVLLIFGPMIVRILRGDLALS